MTAAASQRESRFPLDRPGTKERVAQAILDGLTDAAIGAEFGVHPTSILKFRRRWESELARLTTNRERALEEYNISRKAWRIDRLNRMAEQLDRELDGGYTYSEPTRHGERIHAHPAASELRLTLKQAAEELDQLPRAGVTVNNQNVVIVKQVSGPEGGNPAL